MASDWVLLLCSILRRPTRSYVVATPVRWVGRVHGAAGGRLIPVITLYSSSWHTTWSNSTNLLKVLVLESSMPSCDFSLWRQASHNRDARETSRLIHSLGDSHYSSFRAYNVHQVLRGNTRSN